MEKSQESIQKLQALEQNMQQLELQKQQLSAQLMEVENAIKELESLPETYKIVSNIMVKTDPNVVKSDLTERQEQFKRHISLLEKQEKKLSDKTEELRQEVLGKLKKE